MASDFALFGAAGMGGFVQGLATGLERRRQEKIAKEEKLAERTFQTGEKEVERAGRIEELTLKAQLEAPGEAAKLAQERGFKERELAIRGSEAKNRGLYLKAFLESVSPLREAQAGKAQAETEKIRGTAPLTPIETVKLNREKVTIGDEIKSINSRITRMIEQGRVNKLGPLKEQRKLLHEALKDINARIKREPGEVERAPKTEQFAPRPNISAIGEGISSLIAEDVEALQTPEALESFLDRPIEGAEFLTPEATGALNAQIEKKKESFLRSITPALERSPQGGPIGMPVEAGGVPPSQELREMAFPRGLLEEAAPGEELGPGGGERLPISKFEDVSQDELAALQAAGHKGSPETFKPIFEQGGRAPKGLVEDIDKTLGNISRALGELPGKLDEEIG